MSDNLIIIPHGIRWVGKQAGETVWADHQRDIHGLLYYSEAAHKLGGRPPTMYAPDHDWKDSMEGLDALASVGCRRCGKREWMGTSRGCPGLALIVDGVALSEANDHLARCAYRATHEDSFQKLQGWYDPGETGTKDARFWAEWACSDDLLQDNYGKPVAGGLGILLEW